MGNFFISAFEKLVGVVMVLLLLLVLGGTVVALIGPIRWHFVALGVLVGGTLYVIRLVVRSIRRSTTIPSVH